MIGQPPVYIPKFSDKKEAVGPEFDLELELELELEKEAFPELELEKETHTHTHTHTHTQLDARPRSRSRSRSRRQLPKFVMDEIQRLSDHVKHVRRLLSEHGYP